MTQTLYEQEWNLPPVDDHCSNCFREGLWRKRHTNIIDLVKCPVCDQLWFLSIGHENLGPAELLVAGKADMIGDERQLYLEGGWN